MDTPVTERAFIEQLHELNHKINFSKEQSYRGAKACRDVNEVLEVLKIKVTNHLITYQSKPRFHIGILLFFFK